MKELKAQELRDKSVPELETMLKEHQAALYRLRRDLVFRRVSDTNSLRNQRHSIARIHTVISEKQRGGDK